MFRIMNFLYLVTITTFVNAIDLYHKEYNFNNNINISGYLSDYQTDVPRYEITICSRYKIINEVPPTYFLEIKENNNRVMWLQPQMFLEEGNFARMSIWITKSYLEESNIDFFINGRSYTINLGDLIEDENFLTEINHEHSPASILDCNEINDEIIKSKQMNPNNTLKRYRQKAAPPYLGRKP